MIELTDADRAQMHAITGHSHSPKTTAIYIAGMKAMAERCAVALSMSRSDAQLMAGEMTAGEWRTVSAVLVNRAAACRALAKEGE